MKPPIPSPLEPAPAKKSPDQAANSLRMVVIAVFCFGSMWLLANFIGVAPVGFLVVCFYYVLAVLGTLRVKNTGDAIGWNVSPQALPRIRATIDFNMKAAYAIMVSMWPFLAVSLLQGQPGWFFPIMVFSIPFSFWSLKIEGRFKKMPADEEAKEEYGNLIVAWKEPRFGLKK